MVNWADLKSSPVLIVGFELSHKLKSNGCATPFGFLLFQSIREEIEETYADSLFSWSGRKTHDVAALLKQFLR